MKILFLTNIMPKIVADYLGVKASAAGGWISGALDAILETNVEVISVFPQMCQRSVLFGDTGKIKFYGFFQKDKLKMNYSSRVEKDLAEIVQKESPDIVHIWGTEFPHSLAMTKAFPYPSRTVCSIQGLCTAIAANYRFDLPNSIYYGWTLRDIFRWDNIFLRNQEYRRRARIEQKTISRVGHVIGRTNFDKSYTRVFNSKVEYHKCYETLRPMFYKNAGKWAYAPCEKHSIFITSGSYPLKGMHKVLEAFSYVLRDYPDSRLYITGTDPAKLPFYKTSTYYKYLRYLRKYYGIVDNVTYLGTLDETQMVYRFLKSNVFISASSIENSPNSVGEALMLGVPVVASFVGGTMDFMTDHKEGFLYQDNDSIMLAHYICAVFSLEEDAEAISLNATHRAMDTHNIENNKNQLLRIYASIKQSNDD